MHMQGAGPSDKAPSELAPHVLSTRHKAQRDITILVDCATDKGMPQKEMTLKASMV